MSAKPTFFAIAAAIALSSAACGKKKDTTGVGSASASGAASASADQDAKGSAVANTPADAAPVLDAAPAIDTPVAPDPQAAATAWLHVLGAKDAAALGSATAYPFQFATDNKKRHCDRS